MIKKDRLGLVLGAEEAYLRLELVIGALSLLVMVGCIFLSFLFRYFEIQVINLEEIALLMMVVTTFIGCSVVTALKQHIEIGVAALIKSPSVKRVLPYLVDVVVLVLFSILLYYCVTTIAYFIETGERSLQLHIPIWVSWVFFLFGIVGVIIHSLFSILRNYLDRKITLPW